MRRYPEYPVAYRDGKWRYELFVNPEKLDYYPWVSKLTPNMSLPIDLEDTTPSLEHFMSSFVDQHSSIPTIHALGVVCDDRFVCHLPLGPFGRPEERHVLCGGIIAGKPNSGRTSTMLGILVGRGKTLVVLPHTDKKLLQWLGFACEFQVDLNDTMVIVSHRMMEEWGAVLSEMEWEHVLLDEYVSQVEWKTKCLWVITNDMSRPQDWIQMFRWDKAFGDDVSIPSEVVREAFGNYLVYFGHGIMTRTMWELIPNQVQYEESYPLSLLHRQPVALQTMLSLEYDCVDEYSTFGKLNGISFTLDVEERKLVDCGICSESSVPGVKNTVCDHWLCRDCMYRLAMLYGTCPMCRREYRHGTFQGSMGAMLPIRMKRFIKVDMRQLWRVIRELRGRLVIIVQKNELYDLQNFLSYHGRDAEDIVLVTPNKLKSMRYILNPDVVICMTLTKDMLSILEWYFKCRILLLAPRQSMTTNLVRLHNYYGLFDHNHRLKFSEEQLWNSYKSQF
jgi:hypothetical protein